MTHLTGEQRAQLIYLLVSDQVESAERVSLYLWDILEHGFKGFTNYTDEELLDAHLGAFDEDFFDNETGDNR